MPLRGVVLKVPPVSVMAALMVTALPIAAGFGVAAIVVAVGKMLSEMPERRTVSGVEAESETMLIDPWTGTVLGLLTEVGLKTAPMVHWLPTVSGWFRRHVVVPASTAELETGVIAVIVRAALPSFSSVCGSAGEGFVSLTAG